MGIEVKLAVDESDRNEIYRFRYQNYCERQGALYAVADNENRRLFDDDDDRSTLFLARDDGRMVGSIRVTEPVDGRFSADMEHDLLTDRFTAIADPSSIAVLSRFVIEPEYRGGLVSTLLIYEVAQYCLARHIETIICDCEPHLLAYYRGMGFRPYGEVFSGDTFLLVPMVLFAGDLVHLGAIGSPLLDLLPPDYCDPPTPELLAVLEGAGATDLSDTRARERLLDLVSTDHQGPSIFDGLTQAQNDRLLSDSFLIDFHAGDLLIGEDLSTTTLYVLLAGTAEIRVADRLVSVATEGSLVGEMAMLLGASRSATVRAVTDGRALSLSNRRIEEMLESEPELAARILWNLARQMATKLKVAQPDGT